MSRHAAPGASAVTRLRSAARATLIGCASLWAAALAVALLGGPEQSSFLVARAAIVGMALAALICLVAQAAHFARLWRERPRNV